MLRAASTTASVYRGRLAPSPTGHLHLGHARTFWTARQRASANGGRLVLRNEDLDRDRCRAEFVTAMLEEMRWFGLRWDEGPDCGGPVGPYTQSERRKFYLDAFRKLHTAGLVYPCRCSRRDVERAMQAPHAGDEEPVYPGTCRERRLTPEEDELYLPQETERVANVHEPARPKVSWRFRVPDGEVISFVDGGLGPESFVAGKEFGDFVVWRHDDLPSYQLAVTADDAAMGITEVVRGADLLLSTARQILLYRALDQVPPAFFHCPLLTDERGLRLAKRHDALSLRTLRAQGLSPGALRGSEEFTGV